VDQTVFNAAFRQAAEDTKQFARRFVVDELPNALRFDFTAAKRTTGRDGRVKFLGGRLLTPAQLLGVELRTACRYIWVDGKVPSWVNLAVRWADGDHTYIEVTVSGVLLEYGRVVTGGLGPGEPFRIRGPILPPDWVSMDVSGRFPLGCRNDRADVAEPFSASAGDEVS
jgi:hypothetical protein